MESVEKSCSSSHSSDVMSGIASSTNASGATSGKAFSLKELNRCLRATDVGTENRRTRGAVTRQSTNSLKKKRWFDDVANMSEERHAKRKCTQTEYETVKRKRQCVRQGSLVHTTTIDDANVGDVNADAKKFLKEYNARTQFWECGVCGTDEGLVNLRHIDDTVLNRIANSDLPSMFSVLKESLVDLGARSVAYLHCLEQEFHDNGVLKSARYICNDCYKGLKKGKSSTMMQEGSCNRSSVVEDVYQNTDPFLNKCAFMTVDNDEENSLRGEDNEDDENAHDEMDEDDENSLEEEESESESDEENDEVELDAEICEPRMSVKWAVPRTAYIRGLYPGVIPEELKDLRVVEMSMISIYNPITRLKLNSKGMQYKYFHGHAHSYTIVNDVTAVAARLPWLPSINTFAILKYKNDVCVKELRYRPGVVRKALTWLQQHNHLYKDVHIAYPAEWNSMDEDAELEPESMIVDSIEEEEIIKANDSAEVDEGENNHDVAGTCRTDNDSTNEAGTNTVLF